MIQINLLPEEYRPPDGTNMPMFVTIVVGVTLLAVLTGWYFKLAAAQANLESHKARLEQDQAYWQGEDAKVAALKLEINNSLKRQEAIVNISRSKILWSVKFAQLSRIFLRYPKLWVETIAMNQEGVTGQLSMSCFSEGEDYGPVTNFRADMKNDRLFWYHFKELKNTRLQQIVGTNESDPTRVSFAITLVLDEQGAVPAVGPPGG